MPGLFDDIPSVVDPNVVEKRSGGLFDDIPVAPVAPAPVATGVLAPNPKDDPVTAQVRAEMAAERVAEAEEEKRRHEAFKAGETSWWDLLRPYPGKFKPLTPEQEKAQEKAEAAQEVMGQGLFGLSDEIAAVAGIPGEMIGRGMMNPITAYNYAKARENIELQEAREKAGGLGTLAEIGMGLASGGGLAKAGLTFAPKAAAGLGRRILGSAADAAVAGTVAGIGTGEGLSDRLSRGAVGGVLGGTVGAALPAAGAVLSPITNQVRARLNPQKFGLMAFGSELAKRGRSFGDVAKGMRSATREGYGDTWTVADETADQTRSLFSGVAQGPSVARDATYKEMLDRQAGQAERLVSELERLGGDARTAKQLYHDTDLARRATNRDWFGRVRGEATRVNTKPIVEKIDEHIHLGPPPTRPQQIEDKVGEMLSRVFDNYPPPNKVRGKLYQTAYERDLLRDIEKGYAKGLPEKDIVAQIADRIEDVPPQNRLQMVRSVRNSLDIPFPDDENYAEWQIDTLDRIIGLEQFEATKGFSTLPNDQIATVLRNEVRNLFEDKGQTIDTFGHVWRARENIENLIQSKGLNPSVLGQKPSYNALGVKLKDIRDVIDESLAASSPTYREAMKKAKEGREALAAIERGAEMARTGRARDNIAEFNKLAEEPKQGARVGYTSDVAGQIEGAASKNQLSKVSSPKRRAELRALAPTRARGNRFDRARNREQTMWDTFQYTFGGSPTARRLAEQDEVPLLLQPEIFANVLTGQFGQAGRNLLGRVGGHFRGWTPEVREEIINILKSKNTKGNLARIEQGLTDAVRSEEARRQLLSLLLRSGYGGGAAGIAGGT